MEKFNRWEPTEKYTKTYATVENLNKALIRLGIWMYRHTIYNFPNGRVTALFIMDRTHPESASIVPHLGFPIVG